MDRRLRVREALPIGLALVLSVIGARDVSAHRRDEYLQAARIALAPDAVLVDLDLTPGIDAAESVISGIDRDGDGVLSAQEQQAYAERVTTALTAAFDGAPVTLRLASATFPELSAVRRGEGAIRVRARAALPRTTSGEHALFFRHARLGAQSVFLANALVPDSPRVSITAQRRDRDQTELTIVYDVRPEAGRSASLWLLAGLTLTVFLLLRFTPLRAWL